MANRSNAVSKLHAVVSNDMWKDYAGISEIIPITNAQNQSFYSLGDIWERLKKTKRLWIRAGKFWELVYEIIKANWIFYLLTS